MLTSEQIRKRQNWVLTNPCRRVEDCGRPGYRVDLPAGRQMIATILTIDLFTSPVAWHSTTALVGQQGVTLPVSLWHADDRPALIRIAEQMLEGVGQSVWRHEEDQLSIGIARLVTPREAEIIFRALGLHPPAPRAIGEVAIYDFADGSTEAGQHLFVPQERSIVYDNIPQISD